jgi:hypothetical protein
VSAFLEERQPRYSNEVSSAMPRFFAWADEPPFV